MYNKNVTNINNFIKRADKTVDKIVTTSQNIDEATLQTSVLEIRKLSILAQLYIREATIALFHDLCLSFNFEEAYGLLDSINIESTMVNDMKLPLQADMDSAYWILKIFIKVVDKHNIKSISRDRLSEFQDIAIRNREKEYGKTVLLMVEEEIYYRKYCKDNSTKSH